ncbi:hypothetical protein ASE35_13300 [Lysobacter sp. Root916]|uniref:hypothetical protein n=1 Tax=Lysobacter sp. Root916 TaxID=1736606 RepID=UPI00070B49F5|nr:hypothetical protein [Lysobacter sp. Root916]KRD31938.1 hypothetical protein ASE35_13300 [Lysobacter sp. Root916]
MSDSRAFCVSAFALAITALLLAAPLARAADECKPELGRGWPPATENHGSAVERLFAAGAAPTLSLTTLPRYSTESGLLLIPGQGDADWRLRYAEADDRVASWSGGALRMRVDQEPEVAEVPMPAALAKRMVADWRRALSATVPEDRAAGFHDEDTLLFMVDGMRVSGLLPECGAGELLMRQSELLIKATDDGNERRARRWTELSAQLDELDQWLAGNAAAGAGVANGND